MARHIGKYIIESVLGEGSFGDVYQASDPDLKKSVAIKKLKASPRVQTVAGEPDDTRELFAREAQDLSKLTHPNIVTVHGFGFDETDGGPYLVMELLDGETLENLIRKRTNMPLVQKIEIMHQVAEGLQFAHTRDVIHRDIKPANIMVLSDGTAKLMDFAVAPEGKLIGTPAYMAPEQFTEPISDILTDIFGYGAVYYRLLTGERPFDPEQEALSQTSRYRPPSVGSLVPDCPPWLDLLISRLIAKRRDERLDSVEEMLIETRPILQKLKQERGAELASGIAPLMKAGNLDAANRLIEQVLRLDPLNQEARMWRGTMRGGRREQALARAQELVRQGEAEFGRWEYDRARRTFEEALRLDAGNPVIEKLLEKARLKAEDCRMAQLLVNEVIAEIPAAGLEGMIRWQVESAFLKLTRATRLDERNEIAAQLRNEVYPIYERICDQTPTPRAPAAAGAGDAWYEIRLVEAKRAQKHHEFDYAQSILEKLLPNAPDDRALRALGAVAEDREAHGAARDALGRAATLESRGNCESALHELDEFAEKRPRYARLVQRERIALQKVLEPLASDKGASEDG